MTGQSAWADSVPEAIRTAAKAAFAGRPPCADGSFALPVERNPWVALDDALRAVLPVRDAQVERETRAEVAAELRRAAAGRREYATGAPEGAREHLLVQADTFETAAKIADGDPHVMCGGLPVRMWTEAEERAARGEV